MIGDAAHRDGGMSKIDPLGIDNCSGMTMLGQRPMMLRVWRDHPRDGAVNRQHSPTV